MSFSVQQRPNDRHLWQDYTDTFPGVVNEIVGAMLMIMLPAGGPTEIVFSCHRDSEWRVRKSPDPSLEST